jgi:hypothetical protein
VLATGEVHALGGLARLLVSEGGDLDEALSLARSELETRGDAAARDTLDLVEAARAAPRPPAQR